MPALICDLENPPDYFADYNNPKQYRKTENTCVEFYQFDNKFDGTDGLFLSIYYGDKARLRFFKQRFEGISSITTPDYSLLGDVHEKENEYRIFKSRIVGCYLCFELGLNVIPNLSFPNEKYAKLALENLGLCKMGAISTKGHMDDPHEQVRLRNNVRIIVDTLPNMKTLVVYDDCYDDTATLDLFSYAINRNVKVVIPENALKKRNIRHALKRREDKNGVIL